MTKKEEQKKAEIKLIMLNALIAGGLVFFGAFTSGNVSWQSLVAAGAASAVVILTKIQKYFDGMLKKGMFSFV